MFAKVLVLLCFLAVAAAFSSTGVQRTSRVQLSMKNVSKMTKKLVQKFPYISRS